MSASRMLLLAWAFLAAPPALAASPSMAVLPPHTVSIGQPPRTHLHWGPMAGYTWDAGERVSRISISAGAEPRIPQLGLAQTSFVGFAGERGGSFDWGMAAYIKIPWVHAGFEYGAADEELRASLVAEFAPRRGGLLRWGDLLRVDYRPWEREVLVGLTLVEPLRDYRRTRPLSTHVDLPGGKVPGASRAIRENGVPRDLEASLERIEKHVLWMDRLLTPHFQPGTDFEESAALTRAHLRDGNRTFLEEEAAYHRELERAFTIAAGGDEAAGADLARRAEAVLLDEVLIPFNGCFARIKKPAGLGGLARNALRRFDGELAPRFGAGSFGRGDAGSGDAAGRREQCLEVFRRTLAAIDRTALAARKRWDQKFIFVFPEFRLVWLPLNYGLRPEQADTQAEWDRLAERLTEGSFTDCNSIEYLVNEQFHLRLKEMVRATETYQVLHIHDIRGRHGEDLTDRIGWDLAADGYLRAFTEAVREIDRGERMRLPQFFIFLDENYYAENRSREIVTFLERLHGSRDPELADAGTRGKVRAARRALAEAIASSPTFRHLPDRELRRIFKVHISVTHRFDPAFGGDLSMRDHRKIAFRDVFEDDPGSGEGMATGQGVGEHYNGTGWDDRSILMRGPVLVALKTGVRELFLSQGYGERDLPTCLRELPMPADYEARCAALRASGWVTPVSAVMNRVGYGDKRATVLKAMLYNLAPPGSAILTFDSLWISDYWAGMLTAAALRGVHVVAVAPVPSNAPSSAVPTMVLLRENMSRLFEASRYFAEEISRAGGSLHTGLYDTRIPATDLRGRLDEALTRWESDPRVTALLGLDPEVLDGLRGLAEAWPFEPAPEDSPRVEILPIRQDHRPFLHMKTQLLATRPLLDRVEGPGWMGMMTEHLRRRARQGAGVIGPGLTPAILQPDPASRDGSPGATDPGIAYLLIGSQNQDRRGMLLDGEVTVAVSGPGALTALPDLMLVLGSATWPRDGEAFDRAFPEIEGPGFLKRAFRYIKDQI